MSCLRKKKVVWLFLVVFASAVCIPLHANDNLYSPSRFSPLYLPAYNAVTNNRTLPVFNASDQKRAVGVGMSAFSIWPASDMQGLWSAQFAYTNYFRGFKGLKMSHVNYSDTTSVSSAIAYFHRGFNHRTYNSFYYDLSFGLGGFWERSFVDSLPGLENNRWGVDVEGGYSFRADLDLFNKYVAGYLSVGARCKVPNNQMKNQLTELKLLRAEAYGEALFYSYRVLPFTRYIVPSVYAFYGESEFAKSRFNVSCYYSPNYHFNFPSPVFDVLLGASALLLPTELSVDLMDVSQLYFGAAWHLENFIGFVKRQDPNRTPWRLTYQMRIGEDVTKPMHEISLQIIGVSAKKQVTRTTVY